MGSIPAGSTKNDLIFFKSSRFLCKNIFISQAFCYLALSAPLRKPNFAILAIYTALPMPNFDFYQFTQAKFGLLAIYTILPAPNFDILANLYHFAQAKFCPLRKLILWFCQLYHQHPGELYYAAPAADSQILENQPQGFPM